MNSELYNILHNFFGGNEELVNDLLPKWDAYVSIKRNDVLIHFGSKEDYIYFIQTGTCVISYPDEDEDKIVGFGYPNTFLFSPSILNDQPSDQEVKAIKKMELLRIHKTVFFDAIELSIHAKNSWTKQLENLLIAQIDRQVDLLITSPQKRYKRLLKRSPHVFQFIPQKYIASYLRMSPETLSRLQNS